MGIHPYPRVTPDRTGRRPLYLLSSAGCVVALALLGVAFVLPTPSGVLAFCSLCLFMAVFSLGYGPLTGVMLSEVRTWVHPSVCGCVCQYVYALFGASAAASLAALLATRFALPPSSDSAAPLAGIGL